MGSGISIAALFICLWAPLVVLAGHVGLLVDRVETRGLLIVTSMAQAVVAVVLAFVGARRASASRRACSSAPTSSAAAWRCRRLAAATFAGVVQGLGKFLAPPLVFGFMLVTYLVGGVGHGLKNVTSRTLLIHSHVPSDRHGLGALLGTAFVTVPSSVPWRLGGVLVGLLGRARCLARPASSALAGIVGLLVLASCWRGRRWGPAPVRSAPVSTDTLVSTLARNAVHLLPENGLAEKLRLGRPLRVKLGIDVTAPRPRSATGSRCGGCERSRTPGTSACS